MHPLHQTKIVVGCRDFDTARSVAGFLEEAWFPPPLAVSLFEDGFPRHRVEAYFDGSPDLAGIAAALADPALAGAEAVASETVPDENWVLRSQQALPPVEAGRFVVHGSHDRARIGLRLGAIEIDAGEAFGTAHHATTRGCLLAIDRLARRREMASILDLGCGSGVLAIAAARAWPHAAVVASDVDPVAVDVARRNAVANRARGRIRFVAAGGLDDPVLRSSGPFDLVVANILARPLIALAPRLARAVARGGRVVLSGLLVAQAADVGAAYRAAGMAIERRDDLVGWSVLTLRKCCARTRDPKIAMKR